MATEDAMRTIGVRHLSHLLRQGGGKETIQSMRAQDRKGDTRDGTLKSMTVLQQAGHGTLATTMSMGRESEDAMKTRSMTTSAEDVEYEEHVQRDLRMLAT